MKRRHFYQILSLVALALFICGVPTAFAQKKIKIFFDVPSLTAQFHAQAADAAREEAKQLGIDLTVSSCFDNVATQMDQVENAIGAGYDGIVMAAVEQEASAPLIQYAADKKVPLVVYDRDVDAPTFAFVGHDNFDGGRTCALDMMKTISKGDKNVKATVVYLEAFLSGGATIPRRTGFKSVIDEYPNVKFIVRECLVQREKALREMENVLTAEHNKIDGVFFCTDQEFLGGMQALQEANVRPTYMVGYVAFPDNLIALGQGKIDAVYEMLPKTQIHKAIDILYDYLAKGLKPITPHILVPGKLIKAQKDGSFNFKDCESWSIWKDQVLKATGAKAN